jgi:L-asparaginase II
MRLGRHRPRASSDNWVMTSLIPLIETRRGGTTECVHFGAIAVTDTRGRLLACAGDPNWLTYTRSTLKALQALPFMQAGGALRFGFTQENLAMMCASHSGEPMHVEQIEQMLDKAGAVSYRRLQCGCHVPMFVELGVAPAPAAFDERHHNCSGKHSGFLAMCVQQGWPLESYLEAGHPLQQAIRRDVAAAVGLAPEQMKMGTDGCSAPNYAMPLANLARGYARLASGVADAEFGASFAQLADAMTARPDLVSGTARNDNDFIRAGRGDWVSKSGADGVQVFASRSRGEAFAIKIADGSKIAVHAATLAVLDQLGWMDAAQRAALEPWRAATISSIRGAPVGERQPAFTLKFA